LNNRNTVYIRFFVRKNRFIEENMSKNKRDHKCIDQASYILVSVLYSKNKLFLALGTTIILFNVLDIHDIYSF